MTGVMVTGSKTGNNMSTIFIPLYAKYEPEVNMHVSGKPDAMKSYQDFS